MEDSSNLDSLTRSELIALLQKPPPAWAPPATVVAQLRDDALLSAVYDVVPAGIVETDLDQRIVRCNPAFAAMVGVPGPEIVGRFGWDFFHPESAPPDPSAVAELKDGRRSCYAAQRVLQGPHGAGVAVAIDWAVVRDAAGRAAELVCVVTDVSEQVRAAVDLRRARRRAENLSEQAPVGIMESTSDGQLTSVNPALARVLDYDVDADARAQQTQLRDALADIAIVRDELTRRQLFTDALLETIDVGIVSCDADGTIVQRNRVERALLDVGNEHVDTPPNVAAESIDLLDAAGRRIAPEQYPLARALRGDEVTDTEFKLGPRGGPHRDVVIRGTRITTPTTGVLGAVVAITDITAERSALRELAAEREALRDAQHLGQLGSLSYEVATGRFAYSPEIFRIWGLPADADLIALSRSMLHPADLGRLDEQWNAALTAGGEHEMACRIVRSDGSTRHLQITVGARLDPAGAIAELHGTHLDVTDLTVARLAAVEATTFLTAILAATPDYTFVTDLATGAVVYGSPGKALLGLTFEELMEFGPALDASVVHPDEQPRLRAKNLAARDLADGAVQQLRYQARHADGSWRWLDRRVTPFRRDPVTGRVVEVLGVIRDLTDEHQREVALREQEARFRALVTQVVDYAIIGLDTSGAIVSWNDGAERLKGYSAEQAIGQNFEMFYTDDDRAAGVPGRILEAARTQGRADSQGWRVRADGTRFWADVVVTALHDEQRHESGFVKVTRDLTTQRQLEEAQDAFFAAVSHDLTTPIFVIKMYAELMGDVGAETKTEYARRIGAQAEHLGELVEEIFEFARSRTEPLSLTSVALADVAKVTVEGIEPILRNHSIEVADTDLVAWGDRTAITRILTNLLSNATRYSPAGSAVTVAFSSSADRVRFAVADHGRGIDPDDIATIFGEFNRGRLGQDDGGTGLGLASVQRLTVLQGGRTWIDSELGRGTTVTVELPRVP